MPWMSQSQNAASSLPSGCRYRLVLGTCEAPGVRGSNGVRTDGIPVMASAPRVVPWYAVSRAMTLYRWPSPLARKYWRANFQADSTASLPLVVKNTLFRSPGASEASLAASSIAGGWP